MRSVSGQETLTDQNLDITTDIREISFRAANPKRLAVEIRNGTTDDNPNRIVDVLNITLSDGEAFVLDMTGAQHGYHEPLTPYSIYRCTRTSEYVFRDEFQYFGAIRDMYDLQLKARTQAGLVASIDTTICRHLVPQTTAWEEREGLTLQKLFKLPQKTFEQKAQSLFEDVDKVLIMLVRLAELKLKLYEGFQKAKTEEEN